MLAWACGVLAVGVWVVDYWQWCSGHFSLFSSQFFSSAVTFSHRRRAWIKKQQKLLRTPRNLGVDQKSKGRPRQPLWGPLPTILHFAGGERVPLPLGWYLQCSQRYLQFFFIFFICFALQQQCIKVNKSGDDKMASMAPHFDPYRRQWLVPIMEILATNVVASQPPERRAAWLLCRPHAPIIIAKR